MTRQTSSVIKGAAAGVIAGSAAFMAVRMFTGGSHRAGKTAKKAVIPHLIIQEGTEPIIS